MIKGIKIRRKQGATAAHTSRRLSASITATTGTATQFLATLGCWVDNLCLGLWCRDHHNLGLLLVKLLLLLLLLLLGHHHDLLLRGLLHHDRLLVGHWHGRLRLLMHLLRSGMNYRVVALRHDRLIKILWLSHFLIFNY